MRAHHDREHGGVADRRQAWPVRLLLTAVLVGLAGGPCRAADEVPGAAPDAGSTDGALSPAPDDEPAASRAPKQSERQQRLLEEQRRVRGQMQKLDRQLEPYERDRLRARPLDPSTGRPSISRQDPVAERRELERRNLQFRERQIQNELRRTPGGVSR